MGTNGSLRKRAGRSNGHDDILGQLAKEVGTTGSWVAHSGLLEAVLKNQEDQAKLVLQRRIAVMRSEDLPDEPEPEVVVAGGFKRQRAIRLARLLDDDLVTRVVADALEAVTRRAWATVRAVYACGAAPAWVEGAGRLVDPALALCDSWVANVVKRHMDPYGPMLLQELKEVPLTEWQALRVFSYLQDATMDDIAHACGIPRQDVVDIVWDEWEERSLQGLYVKAPWDKSVPGHLMT